LRGGWITVDCPPVRLFETVSTYSSGTYKRSTWQGSTFGGVVVTIFGPKGSLIYQGSSDSTLKRHGLTSLPPAR